MPTILLGFAVLLILLWAVKGLAKADPRGLVRGARLAGGVAALGGAVLLLLRGQIAVGLPLGITGLSLLGWVPFGSVPFGRQTRKTPGQTSQVRSAFLDMELDHDTGAMRGRVLKGRFAGASLDKLDMPSLSALLAEIDEESQSLLGAYLDRRSPGWRDHAQTRDSAGEGGGSRSGKMTEEEAYQVLGLEPGASAEDIGRAHRGLMKKLHPDQGGSTYLAARVNQAKDVLLHRRHR
jgi:hypothetical protein